MPYHITNLRGAAHHLEEYADAQGFIPLPGDTQEEMAYPAHIDAWEKFVAAATKARIEAQAAINLYAL